jgi:glycosyltransferase involved in cell wall biosynthesis
MYCRWRQVNAVAGSSAAAIGTDAESTDCGAQGPYAVSDRVAHSVVVPVYNSADVLPMLHSRLTAVMDSLQAPFELILVDDHSTDDSWTAITRIAQSDPRVVAYQLERNVGQGQATMIGLRWAAGEFLITLDDDLQHPPEEIPKLLAALRNSEGLDAVFGVPATPRSSRVRRFGSWLFNRLASVLLRKPKTLRNSGFRVIRRSLVERLPRDADFAPIVSTMMFVASRRIGVVSIEHHSSLLPCPQAATRFGRW